MAKKNIVHRLDDTRKQDGKSDRRFAGMVSITQKRKAKITKFNREPGAECARPNVASSAGKFQPFYTTVQSPRHRCCQSLVIFDEIKQTYVKSDSGPSSAGFTLMGPLMIIKIKCGENSGAHERGTTQTGVGCSCPIDIKFRIDSIGLPLARPDTQIINTKIPSSRRGSRTENTGPLLNIRTTLKVNQGNVCARMVSQ